MSENTGKVEPQNVGMPAWQGELEDIIKEIDQFEVQEAKNKELNIKEERVRSCLNQASSSNEIITFVYDTITINMRNSLERHFESVIGEVIKEKASVTPKSPKSIFSRSFGGVGLKTPAVKSDQKLVSQRQGSLNGISGAATPSAPLSTTSTAHGRTSSEVMSIHLGASTNPTTAPEILANLQNSTQSVNTVVTPTSLASASMRPALQVTESSSSDVANLTQNSTSSSAAQPLTTSTASVQSSKITSLHSNAVTGPIISQEDLVTLSDSKNVNTGVNSKSPNIKPDESIKPGENSVAEFAQIAARQCVENNNKNALRNLLFDDEGYPTKEAPYILDVLKKDDTLRKDFKELFKNELSEININELINDDEAAEKLSKLIAPSSKLIDKKAGSKSQKKSSSSRNTVMSLFKKKKEAKQKNVSKAPVVSAGAEPSKNNVTPDASRSMLNRVFQIVGGQKPVSPVPQGAQSSGKSVVTETNQTVPTPSPVALPNNSRASVQSSANAISSELQGSKITPPSPASEVKQPPSTETNVKLFLEGEAKKKDLLVDKIGLLVDQIGKDKVQAIVHIRDQNKAALKSMLDNQNTKGQVVQLIKEYPVVHRKFSELLLLGIDGVVKTNEEAAKTGSVVKTDQEVAKKLSKLLADNIAFGESIKSGDTIHNVVNATQVAVTQCVASGDRERFRELLLSDEGKKAPYILEVLKKYDGVRKEFCELFKNELSKTKTNIDDLINHDEAAEELLKLIAPSSKIDKKETKENNVRKTISSETVVTPIPQAQETQQSSSTSIASVRERTDTLQSKVEQLPGDKDTEDLSLLGEAIARLVKDIKSSAVNSGNTLNNMRIGQGLHHLDGGTVSVDSIVAALKAGKGIELQVYEDIIEGYANKKFSEDGRSNDRYKRAVREAAKEGLRNILKDKNTHQIQARYEDALRGNKPEFLKELVRQTPGGVILLPEQKKDLLEKFNKQTGSYSREDNKRFAALVNSGIYSPEELRKIEVTEGSAREKILMNAIKPKSSKREMDQLRNENKVLKAVKAEGGSLELWNEAIERNNSGLLRALSENKKAVEHFAKGKKKDILEKLPAKQQTAILSSGYFSTQQVLEFTSLPYRVKNKAIINLTDPSKIGELAGNNDDLGIRRCLARMNGAQLAKWVVESENGGNVSTVLGIASRDQLVELYKHLDVTQRDEIKDKLGQGREQEHTSIIESADKQKFEKLEVALLSDKKEMLDEAETGEIKGHITRAHPLYERAVKAGIVKAAPPDNLTHGQGVVEALVSAINSYTKKSSDVIKDEDTLLIQTLKSGEATIAEYSAIIKAFKSRKEPNQKASVYQAAKEGFKAVVAAYEGDTSAFFIQAVKDRNFKVFEILCDSKEAKEKLSQSGRREILSAMITNGEAHYMQRFVSSGALQLEELYDLAKSGTAISSEAEKQFVEKMAESLKERANDERNAAILSRVPKNMLAKVYAEVGDNAEAKKGLDRVKAIATPAADGDLVRDAEAAEKKRTVFTHITSLQTTKEKDFEKFRDFLDSPFRSSIRLIRKSKRIQDAVTKILEDADPKYMKAEDYQAILSKYKPVGKNHDKLKTEFYVRAANSVKKWANQQESIDTIYKDAQEKHPEMFAVLITDAESKSKLVPSSVGDIMRKMSNDEVRTFVADGISSPILHDQYKATSAFFNPQRRDILLNAYIEQVPKEQQNNALVDNSEQTKYMMSQMSNEQLQKFTGKVSVSEGVLKDRYQDTSKLLNPGRRAILREAYVVAVARGINGSETDKIKLPDDISLKKRVKIYKQLSDDKMLGLIKQKTGQEEPEHYEALKKDFMTRSMAEKDRDKFIQDNIKRFGSAIWNLALDTGNGKVYDALCRKYESVELLSKEGVKQHICDAISGSKKLSESQKVEKLHKLFKSRAYSISELEGMKNGSGDVNVSLKKAADKAMKSLTKSKRLEEHLSENHEKNNDLKLALANAKESDRIRVFRGEIKKGNVTGINRLLKYAKPEDLRSMYSKLTVGEFNKLDKLEGIDGRHQFLLQIEFGRLSHISIYRAHHVGGKEIAAMKRMADIVPLIDKKDFVNNTIAQVNKFTNDSYNTVTTPQRTVLGRLVDKGRNSGDVLASGFNSAAESIRGLGSNGTTTSMTPSDTESIKVINTDAKVTQKTWVQRGTEVSLKVKDAVKGMGGLWKNSDAPVQDNAQGNTSVYKDETYRTYIRNDEITRTSRVLFKASEVPESTKSRLGDVVHTHFTVGAVVRNIVLNGTVEEFDGLMKSPLKDKAKAYIKADGKEVLKCAARRNDDVMMEKLFGSDRSLTKQNDRQAVLEDIGKVKELDRLFKDGKIEDLLKALQDTKKYQFHHINEVYSANGVNNQLLKSRKDAMLDQALWIRIAMEGRVEDEDKLRGEKDKGYVFSMMRNFPTPEHREQIFKMVDKGLFTAVSAMINFATSSIVDKQSVEQGGNSKLQDRSSSSDVNKAAADNGVVLIDDQKSQRLNSVVSDNSSSTTHSDQNDTFTEKPETPLAAKIKSGLLNWFKFKKTSREQDVNNPASKKQMAQRLLPVWNAVVGTASSGAKVVRGLAASFIPPKPARVSTTADANRNSSISISSANGATTSPTDTNNLSSPPPPIIQASVMNLASSRNSSAIGGHESHVDDPGQANHDPNQIDDIAEEELQARDSAIKKSFAKAGGAILSTFSRMGTGISSIWVGRTESANTETVPAKKKSGTATEKFKAWREENLFNGIILMPGSGLMSKDRVANRFDIELAKEQPKVPNGQTKDTGYYNSVLPKSLRNDKHVGLKLNVNTEDDDVNKFNKYLKKLKVMDKALAKMDPKGEDKYIQLIRQKVSDKRIGILFDCGALKLDDIPSPLMKAAEKGDWCTVGSLIKHHDGQGTHLDTIKKVLIDAPDHMVQNLFHAWPYAKNEDAKVVLDEVMKERNNKPKIAEVSKRKSDTESLDTTLPTPTITSTQSSPQSETTAASDRQPAATNESASFEVSSPIPISASHQQFASIVQKIAPGVTQASQTLVSSQPALSVSQPAAVPTATVTPTVPQAPTAPATADTKPVAASVSTQKSEFRKSAVLRMEKGSDITNDLKPVDVKPVDGGYEVKDGDKTLIEVRTGNDPWEKQYDASDMKFQPDFTGVLKVSRKNENGTPSEHYDEIIVENGKAIGIVEAAEGISLLKKEYINLLKQKKTNTVSNAKFDELHEKLQGGLDDNNDLKGKLKKFHKTLGEILENDENLKPDDVKHYNKMLLDHYNEITKPVEREVGTLAEHTASAKGNRIDQHTYTKFDAEASGACEKLDQSVQSRIEDMAYARGNVAVNDIRSMKEANKIEEKVAEIEALKPFMNKSKHQGLFTILREAIADLLELNPGLSKDFTEGGVCDKLLQRDILIKSHKEFSNSIQERVAELSANSAKLKQVGSVSKRPKSAAVQDATRVEPPYSTKAFGKPVQINKKGSKEI